MEVDYLANYKYTQGLYDKYVMLIFYWFVIIIYEDEEMLYQIFYVFDRRYYTMRFEDISLTNCVSLISSLEIIISKMPELFEGRNKFQEVISVS